MKKYLVIHKNDCEFSSDYQECKNPYHNIWWTTDVFGDGQLNNEDTFNKLPWIIIDYDTGTLYDLAPTLHVAVTAIDENYDGEAVLWEDIAKKSAITDYQRAMSII